MKIVTEHSTLNIDYEGKLENGELFDTSKEDVARKENIFDEKREYKPLHVTLGQGMLIKGFEDALINMQEGEEKIFNIKSEDAYGEKKPELVKIFPSQTEQDKQLKVGMTVLVNLGEKQLPALVTEAGDNISLDFNHPLAGKDLSFKVKIVSIED